MSQSFYLRAAKVKEIKELLGILVGKDIVALKVVDMYIGNGLLGIWP